MVQKIQVPGELGWHVSQKHMPTKHIIWVASSISVNEMETGDAEEGGHYHPLLNYCSVL